jgi:hypothetical protein
MKRPAAAVRPLLQPGPSLVRRRREIDGPVSRGLPGPSTPGCGGIITTWRGHVLEPHRLLCLLLSPDRLMRHRKRETILAVGKCVAACRLAVLPWPRRGKICPLYREGGARDVR